MPDDFDKQTSLSMMDCIARELLGLEKKQRDLRLEYWRHQAIAYPTSECQHGDTHFCKHCCNNQEAPSVR